MIIVNRAQERLRRSRGMFSKNTWGTLSGFSLVELMVGLAIFSMIMTMIMVAYVGSQRDFITGIAKLDLNRNARLTIEWMRRDIKAADSLVTSRPINGTTYTTGNSELVLRLPSVDISGNIAVPNASDYVVYHVSTTDPTRLERIVEAGAGSSRPSGTANVALQLLAIQFSSGGIGLSAVGSLASVDTVEVSITTAKTILGGRVMQAIMQSAYNLRNRG